MNDEELCKAERRAVEEHKAHLVAERCCEVSFDEALSDWLEHYAKGWRAERLTGMLAKQREEILRHKWIESEKAQRDLGSEAALDWIRNHAAQWRKWYDDEYPRSQA